MLLLDKRLELQSMVRDHDTLAGRVSAGIMRWLKTKETDKHLMKSGAVGSRILAVFCRQTPVSHQMSSGDLRGLAVQ